MTGGDGRRNTRSFLRRTTALHAGAMQDRSRVALWLPLLAAGAVVAAYAGQLGLGRWQTDEYTYFRDERLAGLRALAARLPVSPRPVSELLIHLYGRAVLALDRPLIVTCLGLLWAATLAFLLLAARRALEPGRGRRLLSAALVLSFIAFVLTTNPVTEVFYWPVAAFAYMPTIAGALAAVLLLGGRPEAGRRRWCGAALLLAACSHEIGAAVAIGLALGAGTAALAARARPTIRDLWWIAPALAGLGVMLALVLFRTGRFELGSEGRATTGNMLASLAATVRHLGRDVLTPGDGTPASQALAARLLFATGFALTWVRFGQARAGRWLAALALGLFTGAFFSLLAAYFHYGSDCCERQATTRQALIDLLFVIGATALLGRAATSPLPGWLGPVLLAASLFPFAHRLPAIGEDLANYHLAVEARRKTWASGEAPGAAAMKFFLPPDANGMLIRGTSETIATYAVGSDRTPGMLTAAGRFFGKTTVIACEPWQTSQSWLLRGHFIPACPPHGGPPDIVYDGP